MRLEIGTDSFVLSQDGCDRFRIWHKWQETVVRGECNQVVNGEFAIKIDIFQDSVHDAEELEHQLILPHIIASLEHHRESIGLISIISFVSEVERQ